MSWDRKDNAGQSTRPCGTSLHFVTDTFYHFPAHPLDPTTEEAHTQNATIMHAIGRAAAAFVEGGYEVFLDGVVGPWFLPRLVREWDAVARVEYVILQATLAEELARVLRRDSQPPKPACTTCTTRLLSWPGMRSTSSRRQGGCQRTCAPNTSIAAVDTNSYSTPRLLWFPERSKRSEPFLNALTPARGRTLRLPPTASSVRSCLAPASGSG